MLRPQMIGMYGLVVYGYQRSINWNNYNKVVSSVSAQVPCALASNNL